MDKTGVIIAAAGASRRLRRPKQLLPFHGTTLLRHAAETALEAAPGPVVVVLGAVVQRCREALAGLDVRIVINAAWPEGMGPSIASGMAALIHDDLENVIVMLCDQPAVTAETLTDLAGYQRTTRAEIVASAYAGILGAPALFNSSCFPRLLTLQGPRGARGLFTGSGVLSVPFPGGALDIDEPADAALLETFPPRLLTSAAPLHCG
jgi:molybdenum cofactor cytidylyltransferase